MSEFAIRVNEIGKQYFIGGQKQKYSTFRDAIMNSVAAPIRRTRDLLRGHATGAANLHKEIWALKDITFDVRHGEVVGIIGHNGAGKSTLLKILSHITEPTVGYADIYGRVGSLLEVGTGFHPELTGRENVFLNGAILGMSKVEIERKFDEIVAFSEVENFIDTPVKFYSSGMSVRLAFSVAAHLEPEVLVVDEVLAVGDATFQRKCLNKMQTVGEQGRTVLFVSHNMSAVSRLCDRAILLKGGEMIADGEAHRIVADYLNAGTGTAAEQLWPDLEMAPGDSAVRLRAVRVKSEDGQVNDAVDIRKQVDLEMEIDILESGRKLMPYFSILNEEGILLFTSIDNDENWRKRDRPVGRYTFRASIPGNFLAEGTFFVTASARYIEPMDRCFAEQDAVAFYTVDSMEGDAARGDHGGRIRGVIRPYLAWDTEFIPKEAQNSTPVLSQLV